LSREGTADAVPVFVLGAEMSEPDRDFSALFATLAAERAKTQPSPLSGLASIIASEPLGSDASGWWAAISTLPGTPSRWGRRYIEDVIERCNKRVDVLADRIGGVTAGRVMPDLDQVTIGTGKRFNLSVLFLDICGFSARPNWTTEEQKQVLVVMNIFMAEMLNVVRDFGGTYEKNTGDGLMAYFGETASTNTERVQPAV